MIHLCVSSRALIHSPHCGVVCCTTLFYHLENVRIDTVLFIRPLSPANGEGRRNPAVIVRLFGPIPVDSQCAHENYCQHAEHCSVCNAATALTSVVAIRYSIAVAEGWLRNPEVIRIALASLISRRIIVSGCQRADRYLPEYHSRPCPECSRIDVAEYRNRVVCPSGERGSVGRTDGCASTQTTRALVGRFAPMQRGRVGHVIIQS